MFGWHGTSAAVSAHTLATALDRRGRGDDAEGEWLWAGDGRTPPPLMAAPLYPLLRCAAEESEAFSLGPGNSLHAPIRRRREQSRRSAECKHETARPRSPTSSWHRTSIYLCAPIPVSLRSIPVSLRSPSSSPSPLLFRLHFSPHIHPPHTYSSARTTKPKPTTTPRTAVSSLRSSSVRSGQFSAAVPAVFPLGPRCGCR